MGIFRPNQPPTQIQIAVVLEQEAKPPKAYYDLHDMTIDRIAAAVVARQKWADPIEPPEKLSYDGTLPTLVKILRDIHLPATDLAAQELERMTSADTARKIYDLVDLEICTPKPDTLASERAIPRIVELLQNG